MNKTTTIDWLEIHNFKGIRNQRIEFNADRPTVISGRNGTGKTTIADAYAWLLWGLNSEDQQTANFGIKPNDENGNIQLELNPEVSGQLTTVDKSTGEVTKIKLTRRWVAVFRTKSGEVEPEFLRNKGEYFIDDVPVKEAEYKTAVESMLPPEIFKCITNPYYFPRLHWKDKREILMRMGGDVTLEDIASRTPEFEAFLRELNGKTFDDFVKTCNAKITMINTELAQIPVRIEEVEHNMPQAPDYAALEAEKAQLADRVATLEQIAANASQAEQAKTEKAAEAQRRIRQLHQEQEAEVSKAKEAEYQRVVAANAERNNLDAELRELKNRQADRISEIDTDGYRLRKQVDTLLEQIADMTRRQDALRKEWYTENAKQYPAGATLTCPITGVPCQDQTACSAHVNSWQEARQAFVNEQDRKKEAITEKGRKLGEEIAARQKEADEAKKNLEDLRAERSRLTSTPDPKIAELEAKLANTAVVKAEGIVPTSLPRWNELQQEIDKLNKEMQEAPAAADQTDTITEMREANNRISAINAELGIKATIERQQQRVQELKDSEMKLLHERADAQKKIATAERMTKERMTAVEERINRLFTMVRFQMFEPVATTGDEKPNCVCWVDEAKYADKNKAGKINAGLDIINTFCRHYGVHAPIFIDNAEAVNHFIPTESQLVLLRVSTDNLTIQ